MTHRLSGIPARLGLGLLLAAAGWAAASGPGYPRAGRVDAFETATWKLWIPAGGVRVVVVGEGTTDLDCYVYDPSGRLLGKDDGRTDRCVVDLSRRRGGQAELRIVNLGKVWNRYELSVK